MRKIIVLFLACVMTVSLFSCEKDTEAPGTSTVPTVPTSSVSSTDVVTASPEASTPAGTTATETTNTPSPTKTPVPTQTATATPEPEKKIQTLNYQLYSNCIDGVMLVKNGSSKLGLMDASGKLLVDCQYSSGLIGVGGYAVFERKYVYDKTGKLVYEDANSTIEHCSNGVVLVSETGKWKTDDYEEAKQNGATEERLEEYYTWTTRHVYKKLDGTEIYSVFGDGKCGQFNKQGYAWVEKKEALYLPGYTIEIINLNGEVVREYGAWGDWMVLANNDWIVGEDGFVLVDDVVAMGGSDYINSNPNTEATSIFSSIWKGETLFEYTLNNGSSPNAVSFYPAYNDDGDRCFSLNSLSVMRLKDSFYLYDIERNTIIAEYAYINLTDSKYILVQNSEGKWGYIDRNGTEYRFYEDATSFHDGYAMVKIDGLLYVINENFEIVSEGFKGDAAGSCMNNFFRVTRGDETIFVKFNP